MKRSQQEETQLPPQKLFKNNTTDEDHDDQYEIGKEKLFSNDVIGMIISFLSFDEIQNQCLQLVSHQWYESLLGDFRFALIGGVENYLLKEFNVDNLSKKEDVEMMKLLVTVKQWLFARQYLLTWIENRKQRKVNQQSLKNGKLPNEWLIKLLTRTSNSNTFPKIKILKMQKLFRDREELVVLMIYLNSQALMKMTVFYSKYEDIIIYVDVLSGENEYDWENKLNINPTVKRNTVLHVNAAGFEDADCEIEKYQINEKFFDSLYQELKAAKRKNKRTPFNTFLWSENIDEREFNNQELISNVEFKKDIEIHDSRANYLIELYNLEKITEPKVLDLAWKITCRAFTSIRKQKIKENPDISVSNVIGQLITVKLNRQPRRCANLKFDIILKGSTAKASLFVEEQFYYGHDGYESEASFKITTSDPNFKLLKLFRFNASNNSISWDFNLHTLSNEERKELVQISQPLLMDMFRQLFSIAPHYTVLSPNGLTSNKQDFLQYFEID